MFCLLTLAMPMGGKGGKGGKSQQKFSAKALLKGTYDVNVMVEDVKQNKFDWIGSTTMNNETNITTIEFELVEMITTQEEDNTTSSLRNVLRTKTVELKSDNATHLSVTVEGKELLNGEFQLNNATGQQFLKGEGMKLVILNPNALQFTVFNKG